MIIDQAPVGSWSSQTVTSGQAQQWDGKWTGYRRHFQYISKVWGVQAVPTQLAVSNYIS